MEPARVGKTLPVLTCQRRLNIPRQLLRRVLRCVAADHPAVFADQELGEVPLDGFAAQQAGRFGGEPLVQGEALAPFTSILAIIGKLTP